MMVRADAYQIVERFIQRERAMRERVFAGKAEVLAYKLADCDRALTALATLAPIPEAEQPGLFGNGEAQGRA